MWSNFTKGIFRRGLIPGTYANFNRLFETLSSPRPTASKQKMQNIFLATGEYNLDNTD